MAVAEFFLLVNHYLALRHSCKDSLTYFQQLSVNIKTDQNEMENLLDPSLLF